MPRSAGLTFGRTADGLLVRVLGRGTLRESPALHAFAMERCATAAQPLVLDLSDCEYLDSTFLGCLVMLHKRLNKETQDGFRVVAAAETRQRLFGTNHIDMFLTFIATCPPTTSEMAELEIEQCDQRELGHHTMKAHRQLAQLGGEGAVAFERVADRLAKELDMNQG